jgi:hypothetical protein
MKNGGLEKAHSDRKQSGTGSHGRLWGFYVVGRSMSRVSLSAFRRPCVIHRHGEHVYTVLLASEP